MPARDEIEPMITDIVDAAVKLHIRVGPGLLESVYEAILAQEISRRGYVVDRQKIVPLMLDGLYFEEAFRADLVVEGLVIVELKSVEKLAPVHSKQVLTYLRILGLPVGLLINFGGVRLKDGLHRIVNNYESLSVASRLRMR